MTIRSIRDLAAVVRGRRKDLGMNQAQLAERAGVSRKWIYEFEAGKPTAELGLVLRVLDALAFQLELRPEPRNKRPSSSRNPVDLDTVLGQLRDADGERGNE